MRTIGSLQDHIENTHASKRNCSICHQQFPRVEYDSHLQQCRLDEKTQREQKEADQKTQEMGFDLNVLYRFADEILQLSTQAAQIHIYLNGRGPIHPISLSLSQISSHQIPAPIFEPAIEVPSNASFDPTCDSFQTETPFVPELNLFSEPLFSNGISMEEAPLSRRYNVFNRAQYYKPKSMLLAVKNRR